MSLPLAERSGTPAQARDAQYYAEQQRQIKEPLSLKARALIRLRAVVSCEDPLTYLLEVEAGFDRAALRAETQPHFLAEKEAIQWEKNAAARAWFYAKEAQGVFPSADFWVGIEEDEVRGSRGLPGNNPCRYEVHVRIIDKRSPHKTLNAYGFYDTVENREETVIEAVHDALRRISPLPQKPSTPHQQPKLLARLLNVVRREFSVWLKERRVLRSPSH